MTIAKKWQMLMWRYIDRSQRKVSILQCRDKFPHLCIVDLFILAGPVENPQLVALVSLPSSLPPSLPQWEPGTWFLVQASTPHCFVFTPPTGHSSLAPLGLEWGVKSLLWEARIQDYNTTVGLGVHVTLVKLSSYHAPTPRRPGKASWVLFKL